MKYEQHEHKNKVRVVRAKFASFALEAKHEYFQKKRKERKKTRRGGG